MPDTFFADVSYFQPPVDDSYPYQVLSIRADDGTFRDPNFAQNYAWMRAALDSGRLTMGIVYAYWRPDWLDTANTMRDMIDSNGGLHPKVALMIDLESGGNPGGDQSDGVNRLYWNLVDFCGGNTKRVIGYANGGDFRAMWSSRPDGVRVIGAGYGENPDLPGEVAHQYTDGTYGAGQGLPMGCPPFGNCDMNVADGLTPDQFAAACGIGEEDMPLNQQDKDWIVGAIYTCLEKYVGPIGSDVKDLRFQSTGSRDLVIRADGSIDLEASFPGLLETGRRTDTDLLSAIAQKLGVPGAFDPKPNGDGKVVAPVTPAGA